MSHFLVINIPCKCVNQVILKRILCVVLRLYLSVYNHILTTSGFACCTVTPFGDRTFSTCNLRENDL